MAFIRFLADSEGERRVLEVDGNARDVELALRGGRTHFDTTTIDAVIVDAGALVEVTDAAPVDD